MHAVKKPPQWIRPTAPSGRFARLKYLGQALMAAAILATPAHASMFKGEALDKAADVLAWAVLILAPVIGIAVFLLIHILPEKIAEKKKHPQAKAIQCLCLLSLFFGGMLWPLAWLWAYSKPVLYKLAYGTDMVEPDHGESTPPHAPPGEAEELQQLRTRIVELEGKLAAAVPVAAPPKDVTVEGAAA